MSFLWFVKRETKAVNIAGKNLFINNNKKIIPNMG